MIVDDITIGILKAHGIDPGSQSYQEFISALS